MNDEWRVYRPGWTRMINELMNISMLKIIKLNYSALKGGHYVPGNIFCFMHEYSIVFGYSVQMKGWGGKDGGGVLTQLFFPGRIIFKSFMVSHCSHVFNRHCRVPVYTS